MNRTIIFLLILTLSISCRTEEHDHAVQDKQFSKELLQLKEYFHIPGLSVIVTKGDETIYENYLGHADIDKQIPIDSSTTFPMASLTKMFTAVLIMKLVENKKISLNDAIARYGSAENIPDSIKIKHVLSHTSQGEVGQHFYYSNRFAWLTAVVEKEYATTFEDAMRKEIFNQLGLKNTYLLLDSSQIKRESREIAQPYFYEGEVRKGFIDFGYSASAGITSTVRDLAKFGAAIDDDRLIKKESIQKMLTPLWEGLPYGYGFFVQSFNGKSIVWAYGQYDCYSSLFVKIPEDDLLLVIAANNNLISDPARLIYGDVSYSLFALSFLKNYVFNIADVPIVENDSSINILKAGITGENAQFYRKKLLAQSIAESFMAMFETERRFRSEEILDQVFDLFPDYDRYGDLTLMHNLSFLKEVNFRADQAEFAKFDKQLRSIGQKVLTHDRNNPYANYYLGNYYQAKNNIDSTGLYYGRLVVAKNFSRNWYTMEAENWMKDAKLLQRTQKD